MEAPVDIAPAVWSALRSCKVLSEASNEGVAWLAQVSTVRVYDKGEMILSEDRTAREIGVVMQGHVRAVHFGADGRPVTVLMAWPSEAIGLMAALASDEYRTAFESAEAETRVAMFSLEAFQRLMRDEPDVMMSVINDLLSCPLECASIHITKAYALRFNSTRPSVRENRALRRRESSPCPSGKQDRPKVPADCA